MKALSLWQPWATLVAVGAKKFETRSWGTPYRGALAIHATKHTWQQAALADSDPYRAALVAAGYHTEEHYDLPHGAIIAVCNLTAVLQVPAMAHIQTMVELPPHEPERSFGDYTPGRYAWKLENVRRLEFPVVWRGAQGLWHVPSDLVALINLALKGEGE
jgi:hypothetical protein